MKRHCYAPLFLIAFGLSFYSCGNKGGKAASETAEIQPTEETATSNDTLIAPVVSNGSGIKAASPDTMLMVIDYKGRVVGRYVSTNEKTYTVSVQDDYEVPKDGREIVMFRAKDGKGVIYTYRTNVIIRQSPTKESDVMTMISTEKGDMPEAYPCLGKEGDWYKTIVKGKEGYVRHDLVMWDGMSSF